MARNRMIRPEFWEDSKIHKLTAYARLLFIAMWNFADDEGYLPHDLEWLKAKCFPYDTVKLDKLLGELFDLKRIETKNGIILIKNFLKYQKINRPFPSALKQQFSEHSVNTHEPFSEHSSQEVKDKLSKDKIKEVKGEFGEFHHVLLSKPELEKLNTKFGEQGARERIKNLDEGIEMKGYKYKNHYLTILKWEENNAGKSKSGNGKQRPGEVTDSRINGIEWQKPE